MLDDPAPVLAFRQPLDLIDGKIKPSGFLRWSKAKPRCAHFCADVIGEPAARLLVDFRQSFPGKLGGRIDVSLGLLRREIDSVVGAGQIVNPALEQDGRAGQVCEITEGDDPLGQGPDVFEPRSTLSKATNLADFNENRRGELTIPIEAAP